MNVLWIEGYGNLRASIEALLLRRGHEVDFYLPEGFRERDGSKDIPTFENSEDLTKLLTRGKYDMLVVNREDFVKNGSDRSPSEFAECVRDVRNLGFEGSIYATINCIMPDTVTGEVEEAGLIGLICYDKNTLDPVQLVNGEGGQVF
jgi:hypothetical protein